MVVTGLLILSSGFALISLAAVPGLSHRAQGLFYGWKLAGLGLMVGVLASGPVWFGVGVWIKALELDFGWSRTQLTGAFSLTQLEGIVIGPLIGYLVDRLGPRRMVLIGFTVMALGFILLSRTTSLPIFYLSYTLIMAGVLAGTWLPIMAGINKWFSRKRATAMAIAGEGDFLGGLLLVPLIAWAVTPGNLGWSTTALWTGLILLAVAWPISRSIRNNPEDYGTTPDGDLPPNPREPESAADYIPGRGPRVEECPDFTARQAMRTKAFWYITFGHSLSSMLIATLAVHFVPMLTDQGFSLQTAAYIWSVVMVVSMVSQPVAGYLGDRVPQNLVLFGFTTLQVVGFLLVVFVHSLPLLILLAAIYGVGNGGRVPLTTSIRGDYFGKKAFATITGISMAPQFLFTLAAPLFAASMFDTRGNYTLAFLILGVLGTMSSVCFLLATKPQAVEPAVGLRPVKSPDSGGHLGAETQVRVLQQEPAHQVVNPPGPGGDPNIPVPTLI